jgi:hypothetical protein
LLHYLQLPAPQTAIVEITEEVARSAGIGIQLGSRSVPPEPGWHFGSRYPGDPDRLTIYDFMPDQILAQVANRADFLGMFVFDKWAANADARQSIFYRAAVRPTAEGLPERRVFVAAMVDHGFLFEGPHWRLNDAPGFGLFHRNLYYREVKSLDEFQPWLDRIKHAPVEVIDQALRGLPPEWVGEDSLALERLMDGLVRRQKRIEAIVEDQCGKLRKNIFLSWR